MNHVSVSPTYGNGPTQGQRKTLTMVEIDSLCHGCVTVDNANASNLYIYIYIYAQSNIDYPKRLIVRTFFSGQNLFVNMN